MQPDLVEQECGLLNIKTILFLLLLLPVLVAIPGTPHPGSRAPTPWQEKPKPRRPEDEKDPPRVTHGDLSRLRGKATGQPVRRRLENEYKEDDDEEKENQPPNDENNEQPEEDLSLIHI